MEEVVVVSSEEMEVRAESETEKEEKSETESETESGTEKKMKKKRKRKGGNSSGVVKWERFLRRMMIRVLLVEADDSTRQIIAALLRKCSYRVTAVSDGLKAWEILKGRAHNIDLILTEVDLPSISGFALLTLIMEHEICKKIPIIMMSAQDSVSTVYKCMLRGAADYLVKPIRRNELRNLWQHVWRKQSSNVGINDPQDESVAQQQAEATAENNAGSNHSSGHMACIQRNAKQIEKGSDAQSSCTKPELEAESAPAENVQEFSQPKRAKSFPSDIIFQNDEAYSNFGQKFSMHGGEAEGSEDACKDDNTTPLGKDLKPECQNRDANITNEAVDNNYVLVNSSREAIDLIGAFHNYPNCSSEGISKFDSLPQLDLSLRRSHFIGFCNSYTEEMRTLGHSNASAFTRYTNRALQPPQTKIADASNHQKQYGIDSEKMLSNTATCYSYDTPGIAQSTQRIIISPATGQSKESEVATSCSQQRVFPVAVPVKGIRINNLCAGFGSVLPPMFCAQSVPSPTPSPSSVAQQEPSFQMNILYRSNLENNNFEQQYDPVRQNTNDAVNQTIQKQEHKLDPLENQGHISPTTDQSASSSVCNGGVSHHNSIGYGSACGSNSNVDHVNFVGASESKNEEGFFPQNGSSHRSIQREVALAKFRLKRKERCYEKKVRYESRKKLAEQRPRVKGQFVRQVLIDEPPTEIVGNSYDG